MVTASSMATRSSLELMLDKLQQLEEQPTDIPPPLPVRPISRARRARLLPPRPPDCGRRNLLENGESAVFERQIMKKEDFGESFQEEVIASAVQFDHVLKKTQESGSLKERAEKGICKIQKCYRGYQVRCCYRELTRGVITLQSCIRGENARRGYEQRCRILRANTIIQKQCRKYLEHHSGSQHPNQIKRHRAAENTKDQTRVPYTSLVDLQKRVVRTEAKLRAKKQENTALKIKLLEMEKKWQQREERMISMEKEWQDQLTYIQECLAAAKKNPSPLIRFSNRYQTPDNGRSLHNPVNPNTTDADEDDEVGDEQVCLKLRPHEELRKLKLRFKEWKRDYKNKLRDAQSTFKKIGNTQTLKSQKNWWGKLSN